MDFLWETMSPTPSSDPAAGGQHFGLAAARSKEVAWQVERRWFFTVVNTTGPENGDIEVGNHINI